MWLTTLMGGAGGIVGGVLGFLSKKEDAKIKRSQQQHDRAMQKLDNEAEERRMAHDLAMFDKKAENALAMAKQEGENAAEVAVLDTRREAIRGEFANLKTHWVIDSIRALVRPVLSFIFVGIFIMIGYKLFWIEAAVVADTPLAIQQESWLGALFFSLDLVVCFWFAGRQKKIK